MARVGGCAGAVRAQPVVRQMTNPPSRPSAPRPIMRRVCSWCRRVVDGRGDVLPGQDVTHTICPECREIEEAKIEKL